MTDRAAFAAHISAIAARAWAAAQPPARPETMTDAAQAAATAALDAALAAAEADRPTKPETETMTNTPAAGLQPAAVAR